uniref:Prostate and testis expressed 2 n=1 Tax=Sus scrofa TaxID=9823 RepID=A0A287A856_PIG
MFRLFLLGCTCRSTSKFSSLSLGIRFCNACDNFNGMNCRYPMKWCWKFNVLSTNRSCATDHFYYYHRASGTYLYRYSKLSCRPCEAGMFQIFHDLLRETHCCTDQNRCNDGNSLEEKTKIFGLKGKESVYDTEMIKYK